VKINSLAGRLLLVLALLAGIAPAENLSPAASPADLWRKAVAVFAESVHLSPGRVRISFSLLDGKGQPKRTYEREMRYAPDGQGKVRAELVWARENGRDVTATARVELREREKEDAAGQPKGQRAAFSLRDVPFDPDKQVQVEVVPRPETTVLFGAACRRFDFSMSLPPAAGDGQKGKPVILRGMAWIAESSGAPLKFEFAPDPLPSKVKSLWTVFTYGPGPKGEWLLKEIASEGVGGILFIKKRFRSRIELDDYFPAPKDDQPGK
jgi:hypothetical protein